MAGVVAPFLRSGEPRHVGAVVTHGRTSAHMRFAPEESPYTFVAMVPQNVTEEYWSKNWLAEAGRSSTKPHLFPRCQQTMA